MYRKIIIFISLFFLAGAFILPVFEEISANESTDPAASAEILKAETAIKMLNSIIELKKNLNQRIAEKKLLLEKSVSETEKEDLLIELKKMDQLLAGANIDFERIATGVDIGLFADKKAEQFNWKDELLSLVKPGITEMKRLTAKARQKSKLKDELSFYENLVPAARKANENIRALLATTHGKELKSDLENLVPEWKSVENQIQNRLDIVEMQLLEIKGDERSLIESSRESIKNFFRTRGMFLFIALVACIGIVLLFRFFYLFFMKFIPGYKTRYRPFHIRALDLIYRVMTLFITLFVLILVFYMFEDWVLLSVTIILLMGVGWGAKETLPRFWRQSRLMLNIGSVREGERIFHQGVPWLVKNINVFTILENPTLGVSLRLPIEELMNKTSRKFDRNEPWFPCRKNDWVILGDGTRGCVTSLSHEMVELVQRGGAQKVYQTGDFLALSPLNLSINFRLKISFGISYSLQAESTTRVLDLLTAHIQEQIINEGYEKSLLNLRVEFAQAGASSLDFVVIADFKGKEAPLYNRLSRAIQRWCVDACTKNNWEIPFPQLTIHKES
ncbi:MAG: hypothetical protein KAH09_02535 [Desulfobacula sp.]|nr:hypothetical protein [Desulfobacula sp.]